MADRMQTFSLRDLTLIHEASVDILRSTGVNFKTQEISGIFERSGFRTHGTRVFFTEREIAAALAAVPDRFTLHARNPEFSVDIGGDSFVFMPTGGAPFVAGMDGSRRTATMADFRTCCKLVQTSDQLDLGGYLMVQPGEIPPEIAHLGMMAAYMSLCEKPVFGASANGTTIRDTLRMTNILFGGELSFDTTHAVIAVVNVTSPLQFAPEQSEVIVEMARHRQPVVISNMMLAGATGPVDPATFLALMNAEILSGIVLAQLVSPGTPVVYGTSSAPMDMRTMVSAAGAAETMKISSAAIQLADFYKLPCRTGGSLTDAHLPDAQALAEGALTLSNAVRTGAHFIYHACGQMGSYAAMGFEKWMMDEEVCRIARQMIAPIAIEKEGFDLAAVADVGCGGQYLTHPSTFENFRTLSSPVAFNRKDHAKWQAAGAQAAHEAAAAHLAKRIQDYRKPDIDPAIETALNEYVVQRRENGSEAGQIA
ncbi:MAG: trimethylamine methyltransferase family protein [Desulfobacterales bacterium]|nr:trimethylamine methyltransferase family protein [Desulfobacterales bacterium]